MREFIESLMNNEYSEEYPREVIKNYFDYASSSPPFPEALQIYHQTALRYFGNPSSTHEHGQMSSEKLKEIKFELAKLLGFTDGYIILTSGGTEANNLVIRGVLEKYPKGRLLLAADVHESAWFATKTYAERTDILPIDKTGKIPLDRLEKYRTSKTVICSVLHGNNETGIIHDIDKLGSFCARKNILFHCDGVQTIGRIPVNLGLLSFDFYSFSAHKFGGVHGTGGIFLRQADFIPQIQGGRQEQRLRAGTENLPGLSAALAAIIASVDKMEDEERRQRELAKKVVDMLNTEFNNIHVNSDLENGLPGLISISFPDVKGSQLVTELNLMGFSISSGSACHSGEMSPSRIIMNMGKSNVIALGTIRISMGRYTKEKEVVALAQSVIKAVKSQQVFI